MNYESIPTASGGPPVQKGGRDLKPDSKAEGNHSVRKTDKKTGKTSHAKTYEKNSKNPSGWQETKRYRRGGDPHFDKKSKKKMLPPLVHDKKKGETKTVDPDKDQ